MNTTAAATTVVTMMRTGTGLPGRDTEVAALERLLAGARAGRSGAVVVRGEAGIGKSALLGHARTAAPDMRVLSQAGIDSESELPYAGLHLLLKDVLDGIDDLPPVQAAALRGALGQGPAGPADRFLVGLAVLTLLAELAEERPVLCLVDDAHWFDRASADVLLFAARRLAAEGVLILFAARDGHAPAFPSPGVDEIVLQRLGDDAAREVLRSYASDLPAHVHDRLRKEAAGNPLALVELAAAHRAGRVSPYPLGPPDAGRGGPPPTGSRVEREFAARIDELPARTRTVVLVAAADGTCDTGLVLAAARSLGSSAADLEDAERAGLLMFSSGCLGFRHPLIRSAAYGSATLTRKQEVHRAIVDVLDEGKDPDRRAWHRAAATLGPDEDVARALDRCAVRARERGSPEAASVAHERAAGLSIDAEGRGRRLAAAAAAAADAGRPEQAAALACRAALDLTDAVSVGRLALLHATLADDDRPADTARLLTAAEAVAEPDPRLAVEILLWVVEAGWAARDADVVDRAAETVRRLRLVNSDHVLALARLVHGQLGDGTTAPASVAALRQIAGCAAPIAPRVLVTLAGWHLALGDDARAHALAGTAERDARAGGVLDALPGALAVLARTRWHRGLRSDAGAAVEEGLRLARDIGRHQSVGALAGMRAHLAAVAGDEPACAEALGEIAPRRRTRSTTAAAALGLLDLGRGRFDAAADRLAGIGATTVGGELPEGPHWLPDLVEAAVRAGRPAEARAAAERFQGWARSVEQPWAQAVALRCAALTGPDRDAGHRFAEALALHRGDGARPFERARTELLQGEWLRRARRRSAARRPLRSALEVFESLGAAPWAARARGELRATGDGSATAEPAPDTAGELTPQELQVVRLAAAGLSNRDIGAQLFLSPRTVGYHLYKAFPKLGVASRAQLSRLELPA